MGAHGFGLTIMSKSISKFNLAFQSAVKSDRYENGHDAYSGSIGQKDGYELVSRDPIDPKDFEKLKEKNEESKWGPAMACPVSEVKEISTSSSKTKKIKWAGRQDLSRWEAKNRLEEDIKPRKNCYIRIQVTAVTKMKDAEYKIQKVESPKEWRVERYMGGRGGDCRFRSKTKAEALRLYKQALTNGESVRLIYIDQEWVRVLAKPSEYEVTYTVTNLKSTGKISHFEVWGWAAE